MPIMAIATDEGDLLNVFTSDQGLAEMVDCLLLGVSNDTNSLSTVLLSLQGLLSIQLNASRFQCFEGPVYDKIRRFLRKWRCESLLSVAYQEPLGSVSEVVPFLRSLTIFKALEVPLFIDTYGTKEKFFPLELEDIPIDLNTPIVHVTHSMEAEQIQIQGFKPSDNRNIIEGIWFYPKYELGMANESIYGNRAFETTLAELGVSLLHQGEAVSYKRMVNFILYAGEMPSIPIIPTSVQKATDSAVRARGKEYTTVSIFVPSKFLPKAENFKSVVRQPYVVNHKLFSFCLKEKREFIVCPK